MRTDEAPFSDLVNHPRDTVARLADSRRRTLRLRRRDAEDLVLTTATRADQDAELITTATRMLAAVMRNPVARARLLLDLIREVFPWVRFLSAEDTSTFVTELIEVFQASDDLDNPTPIVQVIAEWRDTAEVLADPTLSAVLRSGATGDHGSVEAPGSAR